MLLKEVQDPGNTMFLCPPHTAEMLSSYSLDNALLQNGTTRRDSISRHLLRRLVKVWGSPRLVSGEKPRVSN